MNKMKYYLSHDITIKVALFCAVLLALCFITAAFIAILNHGGSTEVINKWSELHTSEMTVKDWVWVGVLVSAIHVMFSALMRD